ncbi:hypothetical protein G6L12_30895 [Agrobacterium rhizogenes]|nr:hypothetical protein [Rhizobium rhizogenes]NTF78916.1 hypothetical protein [Rhizobium rhizogenes]
MRKPANHVTLPSDVINVCQEYITEHDIKKIQDIDFITSNTFLREKIGGIGDISSIEAELADDGNGITYIDFNIPATVDLQQSIIISLVLFNYINTSIFTPALDIKNSSPFTLHRSTAENKNAMISAGIKFYQPDEKLGYHNDVYRDSNRYFIPKYVSLSNLFIGYKSPGEFLYINKNHWPEFNALYDRGHEKHFNFRPTPVVYESVLKNAPGLDDWVKIPVFWQNQAGERYAFCNGELVDIDDGTTIISEMKDTLLNTQNPIAIPQAIGRVQVFRNDLGFHSRDIFRDQYVLNGTTRLFARAVSQEAVDIPI